MKDYFRWLMFLGCYFQSWCAASIRSSTAGNDPAQTYVWFSVRSKPVSDFILCHLVHMWPQAYDFSPSLSPLFFFPAFCLVCLKGIMISISRCWCEDHYWYTKRTLQIACVQCISFPLHFSQPEVPIWLKRKENIWFSLSITKRVDESISAEIELCVYMWHRVEDFINFYHCSARDLG